MGIEAAQPRRSAGQHARPEGEPEHNQTRMSAQEPEELERFCSKEVEEVNGNPSVDVPPLFPAERRLEVETELPGQRQKPALHQPAPLSGLRRNTHHITDTERESADSQRTAGLTRRSRTAAPWSRGPALSSGCCHPPQPARGLVSVASAPRGGASS